MDRAYFYVEARMLDGMVSFAHVPITARSDSDAYRRGARLMQRMNQLRAPNRGHAQGSFLNDYVIEVPGR